MSSKARDALALARLTEDGTSERPSAASDMRPRRGFGSELIESRIPYELGGRGRLAIGPGGLSVTWNFRSKKGRAVLETDAL